MTIELTLLVVIRHLNVGATTILIRKPELDLMRAGILEVGHELGRVIVFAVTQNFRSPGQTIYRLIAMDYRARGADFHLNTDTCLGQELRRHVEWSGFR